MQDWHLGYQAWYKHKFLGPTERLQKPFTTPSNWSSNFLVPNSSNQIPSGYLLHNHGKSPFLIGKPSISMGHLYHGYVLNYQRVNQLISFCWSFCRTSEATKIWHLIDHLPGFPRRKAAAAGHLILCGCFAGGPKSDDLVPRWTLHRWDFWTGAKRPIPVRVFLQKSPWWYPEKYAQLHQVSGKIYIVIPGGSSWNIMRWWEDHGISPSIGKTQGFTENTAVLQAFFAMAILGFVQSLKNLDERPIHWYSEAHP